MYTRPEPDAGKIKIVSCIALPVAILVHTVTAWIFGLQIGREWYSAIMGPLFVASALDSCLALLPIGLPVSDGIAQTLRGMRRKRRIRAIGGASCLKTRLDAFKPSDEAALQAIIVPKILRKFRHLGKREL